MPLTITSRNYKTRNHAAGNNFLLANAGHLIEESVEFVVDFNFTSSFQNQIVFISLTQIQVLGTTWGQLGFVVGDSIALTGTINNAAGSWSVSATAYTITDISGDVLTVNSTLDPTSSGYVVNQIMPLSNGANSNTSLLVANTRVTPETIEILHNLIPNSASSGAASLIDSEVNRFRVDEVDGLSVSGSLTMLQLGNRSGGSYIASSLTRLADVGGKRKFKYVLNYFMPYKYLDSNFDEPSIFTALSTVKPWVNIKCLPEENNPNAGLVITNATQLGNVGWYNESYNQGLNDFSISTVLTDSSGNVLEQVDYNQVTTVTCTITGSANFLNKYEVEFYHIPQDFKNLPNSQNELSYLSEGFFNGTGDTYTSYGIESRLCPITSLSHTTGTNEIVITFDIEPNSAFTSYINTLPSEERLYRVSVTVESTSGDENENNSVSLIAIQGLLEKAPVVGGYYDNVAFSGFYNHSQPIIGSATLDYVGCTEDDFVYRSKFNLSTAESWKSLELSMQVVRTSDGAFFNIFDRVISLGGYPVTLDGRQQINYTENLQQFLDSSGRNQITLGLTGNDTLPLYEVELKWSILASWRYWIAQSNALIDFFDPTLPNNGLNNEWMRYLREAGYEMRVNISLVNDEDVSYFWQAPVDLQDYDDSEEITTEIELYDIYDQEQTALVANQLMRVKAIHTKTTAWDEDDAWGWVSVRPFESETNKRISTEWAWTSQSNPLRPLTGEDRLTQTFPSTTVMVTECLIDTSMLDVSKATLIARAETPKVRGCKTPINWIFDTLSLYEDKLKPDVLNSILDGTTVTDMNICCPSCLVQRKDNLKFIYVYAFGAKTLVDGVLAAIDDNCCKDEYEVSDACETGFDAIFDNLQDEITGTDLSTFIPTQINSYTDNDLQELSDRIIASTTTEVVRWELLDIIVRRGLLVQCELGSGIKTISAIHE
jgi:hypothetical protein